MVEDDTSSPQDNPSENSPLSLDNQSKSYHQEESFPIDTEYHYHHSPYNDNNEDQDQQIIKDWNQQMSHTDNAIDGPFVGMEFENGEEVIKFYNIYAFKTGFSIRKDSHYKAKKQNNAITVLAYCCSKEGTSTSRTRKEGDATPPKKQTQKRNFPERRTGCMARIRVNLQSNGKWQITKCITEHNHSLIASPSKLRYCKSYRAITEEQKKIIHMLSDQNIPTMQIMSFLAAREGGSHNISFTRKDLSNEIMKKKRDRVGVDVSSALSYFEDCKATDPLFYSKIDFDEDGTARYIFWIDGRSRTAYKNFGDVITFDTTYMTNKYSMPFAPFIGVNHHRQSIFFGCALIRDEKASSFCWLFKTWLNAMSGRHPRAIITDQDPAMKKAIEEVFPNTVHRNCQWHIMRKASDHLGVIYRDKAGFENEFKSCINDSLTIEEFEKKWKNMIVQHNVEDNGHLTLLYNGRTQWVPAYFRDTFFAGMSTSQRSESINALTKIWMDCQASIYTFVIRFEKLIESRYDREDDSDYQTADVKEKLWSKDPIEYQAREEYTRTIFIEFQKLLQSSTGYRVLEMEKHLTFNVSTIPNPLIQNQHIHGYNVEVDESKSIFSCDCKNFEFDGLLCPHILKVMNHVHVYSLPSHYILQRWTKNAKGVSYASSARRMLMGESLESRASRFNSLSAQVIKLLSEGSKHFETFEMASEKINKITNKLALSNQSIDEEKTTTEGELENNKQKGILEEDVQDEDVFRPKDPPESQCKGKRKPQRWKPLFEKKAKTQRKCGKCGQLGHYFTTCKDK